MAYTGRLATRDSRLANIKLAATPPAIVIPPGIIPDIDLPTSVALAPHSTHLAAFKRTTSLAVFRHGSTITLD